MQPNENSGIKTWQWVVTVVVIVVLILLGYFMYKGGNSTATDDLVNNDDTTVITPTDVNRVVVTDQFPGNIVYVSSVQFANPGFVVIKKDANGLPGDVIGSQYFDKGINPGKVTLKSATLDGSSYYATMYADTDGNKVFDIKKDMPLKDASGKDIVKPFKASTTFTEVKG